ncbi:MAG TPA: ribose 5-phosphate isomerase B [Actinomycetota bacterium]
MSERRSPEEVRAVVATVVDAVAGEVYEEPRAAEAAAPSPEGTPSLADVVVGADHGGFHLKQRIAAELRDHGFSVQDCGTEGSDSVDYPDFAHEVARLVAKGACRWGIVVDGAGIGSAITANKVPGVRAATCWDVSSARNSREHNHANVLALGAGLVGEALALQIVQAWLSTGWGGGRHARRVSKIDKIERTYARATA